MSDQPMDTERLTKAAEASVDPVWKAYLDTMGAFLKDLPVDARDTVEIVFKQGYKIGLEAGIDIGASIERYKQSNPNAD